MRCVQFDISQLYIIVLRVQDGETVVEDISRGIQQFKNLSEVTLKDCSDELTRGVVDGVVASQCIQKCSMGCFSKGTVLVFVLYICDVCREIVSILWEMQNTQFVIILMLFIYLTI